MLMPYENISDRSAANAKLAICQPCKPSTNQFLISEPEQWLIYAAKEVSKIVLLLLSFGYFFNKSFRFWRKSRLENSMWVADIRTTNSKRSPFVPYLGFTNWHISFIIESFYGSVTENEWKEACTNFHASFIAWFRRFFGLKIKSCFFCIFLLGLSTCTPRSLNGSLL